MKVIDRYYSVNFYELRSRKEFELYIVADHEYDIQPIEFPDKFKLDYKTSYNILKRRINCRVLENYPKSYIIDQFNEYIHQINHNDLYSVALAYNFLSVNKNLLYPDIPFEAKTETIRFRKSELSDKLIPVDITRYQDLLKWYTEQIHDMILKIRVALDNLD